MNFHRFFFGYLLKRVKFTMARTTHHWSQGLLVDLSLPSKWILHNDDVVVIADRYAKAKFHYLVLPKDNISSIFDLTKNHLKLLNEMYNMAKDVIKMEKRKLHQFKIGFHAEPSMQHLHMHVISTDFISPSLKTIRHWNSFNTPLFIAHDELVRRIWFVGKIMKLPANVVNELRKTPLECHRCGFKPNNIQALKKHLSVHSL